MAIAGWALLRPPAAAVAALAASRKVHAIAAKPVAAAQGPHHVLRCALRVGRADLCARGT